MICIWINNSLIMQDGKNKGGRTGNWGEIGPDHILTGPPTPETPHMHFRSPRSQRVETIKGRGCVEEVRIVPVAGVDDR